MIIKRTDLAVEAKEIWRESAGETTQLMGVEAREKQSFGLSVETVKILDEMGEQSLGKPKGTYITITLPENHDEEQFTNACLALSAELRELINDSGKEQILVVGLGNRYITPDNLGPNSLRHTMVTRHLVEKVKEYFGNFRPVSTLEAGVLANTGVESAEMVRALCEKVRPAAVIVIDALASRRLSRVCTTIQLADTGIVPGSGVGNSRAEISQATLGVPVIAIGVPTVVDAGTLAADLMESAGIGSADPEKFGEFGGNLIVTPRDIDEKMGELAKIIGYSINLALQDNMTISDVTSFLS
ncbi:MAG: GPR endopeptidase [Clostridiales bacterium]|mgnify:CR=1 FL=1|jgi:spore protease|nr:GPR endopeptidase [Clostridiales bacterium]